MTLTTAWNDQDVDKVLSYFDPGAEISYSLWSRIAWDQVYRLGRYACGREGAFNIPMERFIRRRCTLRTTPLLRNGASRTSMATAAQTKFTALTSVSSAGCGHVHAI